MLRSKTTISRIFSRSITVIKETDHIEYRVPNEMKVNKIEYSGPETFKVGLCIERPLSLIREMHPIEFEMNQLSDKKSGENARHKFGYFDDYYDAWLAEKKKSTGDKKKKGAEASAVASKKAVLGFKHPPNPADKTPEELAELTRTFGVELTPYKEYYLNNYQCMPRYSLADQEDNRYSLFRKQASRLYLIVKDPITKFWRFPETVRQNPESFIHSALRQMELECSGEPGSKPRLFGSFLSFTPGGHYVNPVNSLEKTFFFNFYIRKDTKALTETTFHDKMKSGKWYTDYQWVTKEEFKEYTFENDKYYQTVYDMCYDQYF